MKAKRKDILELDWKMKILWGYGSYEYKIHQKLLEQRAREMHYENGDQNWPRSSYRCKRHILFHSLLIIYRLFHNEFAFYGSIRKSKWTQFDSCYHKIIMQSEECIWVKIITLEMEELG